VFSVCIRLVRVASVQKIKSEGRLQSADRRLLRYRNNRRVRSLLGATAGRGVVWYGRFHRSSS
jgi:hypothetical protein